MSRINQSAFIELLRSSAHSYSWRRFYHIHHPVGYHSDSIASPNQYKCIRNVLIVAARAKEKNIRNRNYTRTLFEELRIDLCGETDCSHQSLDGQTWSTISPTSPHTCAGKALFDLHPVLIQLNSKLFACNYTTAVITSTHEP